ncbi:uncharacterized protein IWZ02DRAFT_492498 [Phyllosticta citriasiana]|uniref:Uncharacterized protein n=1 Tax=Phyllosticta citriasiana TaxID=595635 RepID=A0ABR1K9N1_9PEZI
MLSLKLSLAALMATVSAVSLDNMQTDATLHDYMVYASGIADSNPPWCEVSYNSLDLSSVTAFGGVTKNTCGSCIEVCGTVGCKHLLVIDQCSRPDGQLDISTGAGDQICGQTTGHCQVDVKSADAKNCAHIWNGRMFYDYTPLYGGFGELKKYVDNKGGAVASSAPAPSSVETSAPAPTSFVFPTSSVASPTSSPVVLSTSSPAPVESSFPASVFTPPTSSSTPLQVETTPAVVSSTPAYTPPVIVPPFPFTNSSTSAAPLLPTATAAAQGTGSVCPFRVTKTFTPTTTLFVTVSGTPTPVAVKPAEEPEEEVQPQSNQEPQFEPTPEEEQEPKPGQEQQQEPQPQPQPSSQELTTTNTLRATQTLFTTLTTRVVAIQSATAPTAPTGVPLSTGTPGGRQAFQGQGWNSTSSGSGSGSGYERRSGHLRGHVGRGGSVRRGLHGHAHGHGHGPGL